VSHHIIYFPAPCFGESVIVHDRKKHAAAEKTSAGLLPLTFSSFDRYRNCIFYLKNKLHIVPVRPEQEMAFFQQHGQRILASGESISEVLRIFNALPVIIDNGS
jgi:hypothetical protein